MTREGFSEMLVTIRESKGIGKMELCRMSGFLSAKLAYIEYAKGNYKLDTIIQYTKAMNLLMVLEKDADSVDILCNNDFSLWLTEQINRNEISFVQLGKETGYHWLSISRAAKNKTVVSIDMLLGLVDYFGYEIRFMPTTSFEHTN